MPEISSIGQNSYFSNISSQDSKGRSSAQTEQTAPEKKQTEELKKRDAEVRAHEMAHAAAGGQYIRGGASFEYQNGPDGQRYAVGGEVSIDTSAVKGDPSSTIQKMQVVKRAALSPASPSGQDRAIAASASAVEAQARQDLAAQKKEGSGSEAKTGARVGVKYDRNGILSASKSPASSINLVG